MRKLMLPGVKNVVPQFVPPTKKFRGPASTNHVMRSLLLAGKRPPISRGSTLANLIRSTQPVQR